MPVKPEILKRSSAARSRLFEVESLNLRFSNGVERTYERLASKGHGAVMMVAITDEQELLLVREYACGPHDYVLTLPKGKIDAGETPAEAAHRELQEEVGFGSQKLTVLKHLTTAPSYMGHGITLVIAEALYPSRLEGDEPEPLEVVRWPLNQIDALALHPEFNEGRAIAALYLLKLHMNTLANESPE